MLVRGIQLPGVAAQGEMLRNCFDLVTEHSVFFSIPSLHPFPGRINPLEAESAGAWVRLLRGRSPLHRLPEHLLPAAFVAMQAEEAGRDWQHALNTAGGYQQQQQQEQQGLGQAAGDGRWGHERQGRGQAPGRVEEGQQAADPLEPKPPGLVLSRWGRRELSRP